VQALAVSPAGHEAARELVDDEHFAALDDVVHVTLEEGVGLQGLVDVVQQLDIARVIEVLHLQGLFHPGHTFLGEDDGPRLLVDRVVPLAPEPGNDLVDPVILVRGFVGGTRDDEWRSRLVDEDAVHLVDDGIVEVPLDIVLEGELHVVAQVIESELVVRPVGDVGAVGGAPFRVGQAVDDDTDGKVQEVVDGAHPGGVAARQVVVHRDEMAALAGQGVEVQGHGRREGLPFARLHLRDLALVKDDPPDELHVEGAHPHGPAGRLPNHGEGLRQDVVEAHAAREFLLELGRLGLQLPVGEAADAVLEAVDLVHEGRDPLQLPFVLRPEQLLDEIQHGSA